MLGSAIHVTAGGHEPRGRNAAWRESRATRARTSQALAAVATKGFYLDLLERAVVLGLFINFANNMLGRLVALVQLQIAHPE